MSDSEMNHIPIRLNTIAELFTLPESDPFEPSSRYVSGIDEVVQQLRRQNLAHESLQLNIALPPQEITPGLEAATKGALARYAAAQVDATSQELEQLRRRGRFSLISAIAIILIAIVVVVLIGRLNLLGDTLQSFLVAGLSVFSWVAVWEPFNIYLYEWRAPARTRYIFERLREAEIAIHPS